MLATRDAPGELRMADDHPITGIDKIFMDIIV